MFEMALLLAKKNNNNKLSYKFLKSFNSLVFFTGSVAITQLILTQTLIIIK